MARPPVVEGLAPGAVGSALARIVGRRLPGAGGGRISMSPERGGAARNSATPRCERRFWGERGAPPRASAIWKRCPSPRQRRTTRSNARADGAARRAAARAPCKIMPQSCASSPRGRARAGHTVENGPTARCRRERPRRAASTSARAHVERRLTMACVFVMLVGARARGRGELRDEIEHLDAGRAVRPGREK
jgi:hypothetical protein